MITRHFVAFRIPVVAYRRNLHATRARGPARVRSYAKLVIEFAILSILDDVYICTYIICHLYKVISALREGRREIYILYYESHVLKNKLQLKFRRLEVETNYTSQFSVTDIFHAISLWP